MIYQLLVGILHTLLKIVLYLSVDPFLENRHWPKWNAVHSLPMQCNALEDHTNKTTTIWFRMQSNWIMGSDFEIVLRQAIIIIIIRPKMSTTTTTTATPATTTTTCDGKLPLTRRSPVSGCIFQHTYAFFQNFIFVHYHFDSQLSCAR